MDNPTHIIDCCRQLLEAYKDGRLGDTTMPEDCHPSFSSQEERLVYFTLPMALNYQRDSYKLWQAALKTFNDPSTWDVFDLADSAQMPQDILKAKLLKHKLALQPNKHVQTWQTIAQTLHENWGTLEKFFEASDSDVLVVKNAIQIGYKKGFPYLSGPKIFNYWSFVIGSYGGVNLKNKEFIEIAPDTHITKCSVKLGVITAEEAEKLTKDQVSARWRELLRGSGITPIEMHPPLWFWSRNSFIFQIKEVQS